ncbi:hypothetical protein EXIGLDRAFT_728583 [Exidia glandulosa HHB12029]|uniref:Microbial-type PARG catalytic domain-containing protein n=1 Tax=Exidia glandulosa HHB12029 TaxID=1314781 RepID=A0A165Q447_EXIGL|nr:hypothetical protein EXIGLDRAFT_728583 [Exidia glandulosa HHB12029]
MDGITHARPEAVHPGDPNPHLSKAARSKLARETINKTIPSLLKAHPRALRGVQSAQLLVDIPGPRTRAPVAAPVIRVIEGDTLGAATELATPVTNAVKVAVLNMASPLRPGGGVLSGASSQEESLCMRTTLYPSLREEWYRLPEHGVVYSPDVLVFRAVGVAHGDRDTTVLPKTERWFVDVISCAAVRCPDLSPDGASYASGKDRDGMRARMVQILRCARAKGVKKLVLGALGCGAYGNPPEEVAALWRAVLLGTARRPAENWEVDEVVFAIKAAGSQGRRNLEVFQQTFADLTR